MTRLATALGWLYGLGLIAFLMLPVLVIIPASLGNSEILEFPPAQLTGRWYGEILAEPGWIESALQSLRVAAATAAIATVLGLMIGIAHLRHGHLPAWLRVVFMLPMLVPHVILATGLFSVLLEIDTLGEVWTLVLVNAAIALPVVTMLMLSAFDTIDPLLWTAASSLGARSLRIMRTIILPILASSIATAVIMAFFSAWDETTFAVFIGPSVVPMLPSRLFAYLQQNVTPVVAAVATLLLGFTLLGAGLAGLVAAWRRRARARGQIEAGPAAGLFETLHEAGPG